MFKKLFKKKTKTVAQPELELKSPVILRYPKILPTECQRCKCLYQSEINDFHIGSPSSFFNVSIYTDCPICGLSNIVKFDEPPTFDDTAGKVEVEHV